jgi:hypothetical protein
VALLAVIEAVGQRAQELNKQAAAATLAIVQVQAKAEVPQRGAVAEPSPGLEPETTPYHWNVSGDRWQPTATGFGCFCGFGAQSICH